MGKQGRCSWGGSSMCRGKDLVGLVHSEAGGVFKASGSRLQVKARRAAGSHRGCCRRGGGFCVVREAPAASRWSLAEEEAGASSRGEGEPRGGRTASAPSRWQLGGTWTGREPSRGQAL